MPRASRTPARASWLGIWPSSRTLNGSPGARKRITNTTRLTPSSNRAVSASSLDRTRAMGLSADLLLIGDRDEPLIREREEFIGMNGDAAHLLVVTAVVRQCPQEGVGRLL